MTVSPDGPRPSMESRGSPVQAKVVTLLSAREDSAIDPILVRIRGDYVADIRRSFSIGENAAKDMAERAISALLNMENTLTDIGHVCCSRSLRRVGEYWFSVDEELRAARLQYLFIAPESRRRGYGAAALTAIHAAVADLGCGRVELSVLASNAPALALYRSCGYVVDSHEMTCLLPISASQSDD